MPVAPNPATTADQLRAEHQLPTHEEFLATLSRAGVDKHGNLVIDYEKVAAGDAAHLASLRALLAVTPAAAPINTYADSHTLTVLTSGAYIRMNKATAQTLTLPTNATAAIPIGSRIIVRQSGAGELTIAPAATVELLTPETVSAYKQGSTVVLTKVATNTWELSGELEPLDADTPAVLSAISAGGGALSLTQSMAVNDLIAGWRAAGLWDDTVILYGFVGGSEGAHAVNFKTPGTYDWTTTGDFIHDTDGTINDGAPTAATALLTGYNPSTGGGVKTDYSFGAFRAGAIGVHALMGCTEGSNQLWYKANPGGGERDIQLASALQRTGGSAVNGLTVGTRSGATVKHYIAGTEISTGTPTDNGLPNADMAVYAVNGAGAYNAYDGGWNIQLAFVRHKAMSPADVAAVTSLVNAFQTAVRILFLAGSTAWLAGSALIPAASGYIS